MLFEPVSLQEQAAEKCVGAKCAYEFCVGDVVWVEIGCQVELFRVKSDVASLHIRLATRWNCSGLERVLMVFARNRKLSVAGRSSKSPTLSALSGCSR